jgi:hypothetical protein
MAARSGRAADPYKKALAREKGNIRNCDDAALMAGYLEGNAQLLLGAVSPRLIWQGAQARGLTTMELVELMHDKPGDAIDLMWEQEQSPPGT